MDSCFDLVRSDQHGVASGWSAHHPLNAGGDDETQIQIFADWSLSHAKRATKDSRKNPEYHVVVIKRLRTDKNCPAEKSWPNHVKNEQHIGSENIYISLFFIFLYSLPTSFFIFIVQDEPVKYYMKYMTKPPLFSSETERQSRQQKPQTATSYRELIEIQKKKTTERDDRHVFILLNSQWKIL